MGVLLSIKPKYVKEIQTGNKLYEFRKAIFKQETNEIFVYESAPTKQIVGKIYVEDIIEDTPQKLWNNFSEFAGINHHDFFEYFKGKERGYAIKIKEFESFNAPINPYKENPKFTPPQSFAYISKVLPGLE